MSRQIIGKCNKILGQQSQDGHSGKEICLATTLKENKVLLNVGGQNVRALLDKVQTLLL